MRWRGDIRPATAQRRREKAQTESVCVRRCCEVSSVARRRRREEEAADARVRKLTMTQTAVLSGGTAGMLSGPLNAIGKLMSRSQDEGYWTSREREQRR